MTRRGCVVCGCGGWSVFVTWLTGGGLRGETVCGRCWDWARGIFGRES